MTQLLSPSLYCVMAFYMIYMAHAKKESDFSERECGVFRNRGSLTFSGNDSCLDDSSCPPWFLCINNKCKCGQNRQDMVCCDEDFQQSAVLDCYCVTHDEKTGETVAGACFYNCVDYENVDPVYYLLPPNISDLNQEMCKPFNRTGPLCGECVNGTYPLVYSFNLSCVQCPDGHKNWWKFILISFIPLTVFYFIVLFFKISVTTSHLHGFVIFSQIISSSIFGRIALQATETKPVAHNFVKICGLFYGVWNLDFFRTLIPGICLQTTTLQTLALDYVIAVYPLFLMIVSYILIELHEHNFRVVVFLWKPFRFVFTFFRRNWDSRTSVIDAYATFFLLSFMKFGSVSYDLLIPAHVYHLRAYPKDPTLVLYYNGNIEYFGEQHLPYGIVAVTILFFFIVIPVLILLLYPFRLFQNFLNCFPVRWHILHTFVDSFQGCYKDGTEPGTRDCRWFAALFLILRFLSGILYAFINQLEAEIVLFLLFALLLVTVQPFRPAVSHYTKINVFFVILLSSNFTGMAGMNMANIKAENSFKFYLALSIVSGITPLLYMACVVVHWFFSCQKWGVEFMRKVKAWQQGYDVLEIDKNFEESLPDRAANPGEYHEGNLTDFGNYYALPGNSLNTNLKATY